MPTRKNILDFKALSFSFLSYFSYLRFVLILQLGPLLKFICPVLCRGVPLDGAGPNSAEPRLGNS
jgi:hypothetical protein